MKFCNYIGEIFLFRWLFDKRQQNKAQDSPIKSIRQSNSYNNNGYLYLNYNYNVNNDYRDYDFHEE